MSIENLPEQLTRALDEFERRVQHGALELPAGQKVELYQGLAELAPIREELEARIANLLVLVGFTPPGYPETAQKPLGSFEIISKEHRIIRVGEEALSFGPNEFAFLSRLIRNPGEILPTAFISKETGITKGKVRAAAYAVRKKIEQDPSSPQYIEYIRKGSRRGYRFNASENEEPREEKKPEPATSRRERPRSRRRTYSTSAVAGSTGISREIINRWCNEAPELLQEGDHFVKIGTGTHRVTKRITAEGRRRLMLIREVQREYGKISRKRLARLANEREAQKQS